MEQKLKVQRKYYSLVSATLILVVVILACGAPTVNPATSSKSSGAEETLMALNVQATVNAKQKEQLSLQLTDTAQQATNTAIQNQQQQQLEQPPQQQGGQVQPAPPTYTPYPTYTPEIPQENQQQQATGQDFETRMKSAKILMIDNMRDKSGGSVVPDALAALGLQRNVTSHISDVGNFLTDLRSGTKWDLIIVNTEAKERVKGELWDGILEQVVRNKAGVVAEFWYAWDIGGPGSKMGNFLAQCGVEVHRDLDWQSDLYLYALAPDDSVFTTPNSLGMPAIRFNPYWAHNTCPECGWEGDLLKKTSGSDAILLAGTHGDVYDQYGVLVRCFDGRGILQSFSTHDYKLTDMTRLWTNYIYNTLKSHYEALGG
jgi:hypothetical protein